MARNNVKLLTDKQLTEINGRYIFKLSEDEKNVIVTFPYYNRQTSHSVDSPFSINVKTVRRITFTKEAISFWIELQKKRKKYTLVEVQNAVNQLYVFYQKLNLKNVEQTLNKTIQKIKKV